MADSIFAQMAENPEYQQTIQKLMQTPPAIRALVGFGDADAAFISDITKKNLVLGKLGSGKVNTKAQLDLAREKLDMDKTLGVGTHQAYYNLRTQMANDALSLERDKLNTERMLGTVNLGLSGFQNKISGDRSKLLTDLYLGDMKQKYGLGG